MKLNLGCGRNPRAGWVNIDCVQLDGVDNVVNLDDRLVHIPYEDNTFDEFYMCHFLEHVNNVLPLMQECWRVAKPDAKLEIRLPHGANDDAFTDPTHVRYYFPSSFIYFSQPAYHRADYGYRGDWQAEKIQLLLDADRFEGMEAQQAFTLVESRRNMVREMVAFMCAVKPARPSMAEFQKPVPIDLCLVQGLPTKVEMKDG